MEKETSENICRAIIYSYEAGNHDEFVKTQAVNHACSVEEIEKFVEYYRLYLLSRGMLGSILREKGIFNSVVIKIMDDIAKQKYFDEVTNSCMRFWDY